MAFLSDYTHKNAIMTPVSSLNLLLLLEPDINEIIDGISAWPDKEKKYEDDEIDKCQFTFRHHRIMDIKESDTHGNDHRNRNYPDQQTCNEEKRAAEFTDNRYHKGHIAAKAQYTRIIIDNGIEIHHLVQTMGEEKYAEEHAYNKNQKRNTFPSERLGK